MYKIMTVEDDLRLCEEIQEALSNLIEIKNILQRGLKKMEKRYLK